MAKFKPCNEDQLVMLPISLQNQFVPGTLEYTISQLVEKHIDLSVFDARYNNDETGAAAIHPKILWRSFSFFRESSNSYPGGFSSGMRSKISASLANL